MVPFYLFVLVGNIYLNVVFTKELPPYFPKCYQNQPMLSECIKNATFKMRPFLIEGIPELDIAEIEPLVIPMIKLEQGTKMVNYKAMLKNVTVHGVSTYNFTDLYVQTDMFAINGKVKFGQIIVEADYFITGRILRTAIHGMGNLTAVFNGTTCEFNLRGQVMQKEGTEYYSTSNTAIDIKADNGYVDFENLFEGDKTLSKHTNDFIKDNAKKLAKEVKPAIEKVIAMYADDLMQKVSSTIPFNTLLPKSMKN